MPGPALLALAPGAAALAGAAWAVRGRASNVFGPSVWRGPNRGKRIALTFDDGPVPATRSILEILLKNDLKATFFQVGLNVERYPQIAREVLAAGHELGNHSWSHSNFAMRLPHTVETDFSLAQHVIEDVTGVSPEYARAPYGVRWFGFRRMQTHLGLTGAMWTVIGQDWRLGAEAVAERVLGGTTDGAIICLHDGRGVTADPDVAPTIEALRIAIPRLLDSGYHFETISELLCPPN